MFIVHQIYFFHFNAQDSGKPSRARGEASFVSLLCVDAAACPLGCTRILYVVLPIGLPEGAHDRVRSSPLTSGRQLKNCSIVHDANAKYKNDK